MTAKSTSLITVCVALVVALTLGGEEALAVCTNPSDTIFVDGVQTRIECNEGEAIDLTLDLNGFEISTRTDRNRRHGIQGSTGGEPTGDITIHVEDGSIKTFGTYANGVDVRHRGEVSSGKNSITVNDLTISTQGTGSAGIFSLHQGKGADDLDINRIDHCIDIDAQDSILSTTGDSAHGIYGRHAGNFALGALDANGDPIEVDGYATGSINIITRGVTITTEGTALDSEFGDTYSHGIYGRYQGTGNTTITINDNSITASGEGSSGVRVESDAEVDDEGYRKQTVTVNGRVIGREAGVYLADGGRVVIGPRGSIASESGIAILVTGDTPGADPGDPVIKPKLRVDLNLDGRRVAQVIGNFGCCDHH